MKWHKNMVDVLLALVFEYLALYLSEPCAVAGQSLDSGGGGTGPRAYRRPTGRPLSWRRLTGALLIGTVDYCVLPEPPLSPPRRVGNWLT